MTWCRNIVRGITLCLWHLTTKHRNTLQHYAIHCNTRQYTAIHCNLCGSVLQRGAVIIVITHEVFDICQQNTATRTEVSSAARLSHLLMVIKQLQLHVTVAGFELYCIAVCCSVLQRVAAYCWCSVQSHQRLDFLNHDLWSKNLYTRPSLDVVMQCVATWCSVLQCVTNAHILQQHIRRQKLIFWNPQRPRGKGYPHTLQHTALTYSLTAPHSKILQHFATHCIALKLTSRSWRCSGADTKGLQDSAT